MRYDRLLNSVKLPNDNEKGWDAAAVRRRGRRGGAPGDWRSIDGRRKHVRRRGDGSASVLSYLGKKAVEEGDRHFHLVLGLPYIVLLLIYLEVESLFGFKF